MQKMTSTLNSFFDATSFTSSRPVFAVPDTIMYLTYLSRCWAQSFLLENILFFAFKRSNHRYLLWSNHRYLLWRNHRYLLWRNHRYLQKEQQTILALEKPPIFALEKPLIFAKGETTDICCVTSCYFIMITHRLYCVKQAHM